MFTIALFILASDCPQISTYMRMDKQTVEHLYNVFSITQCEKGMNHWYMRKHEYMLKNYTE